METLLLEIISAIKDTGSLDDKELARIIRKANRGLTRDARPYSKKRILPYYLKVKELHPEQWECWNIDEETERNLVCALRMKPRRTASGVATITVITKPWPCSSSCLYCPSDVRMPKSYLHREPACQRAERNFFDPYLQVTSRLRALVQMGHATDKIELIVLGGTWSDYPESYQIWFITELFRALNDGAEAESAAKIRRSFYRDKGLSSDEHDVAAFVQDAQKAVTSGEITYNQAVRKLYGSKSSWAEISADQSASFDDLSMQHQLNETARHRVVGLVVETRPDAISCTSLTLLRRLGCTKIQMGVQSLDQAILDANARGIEVARIRTAFELVRIFGFKIHAHFMANLLGATPESDKADYLHFVTDDAYLPDEVKIYPCALVDGTKLAIAYEHGLWRPYSEDELIDVLSADIFATPPYTRISRMIRDISADDIVVGNKKANLRQLVENHVKNDGSQVSEIRYREIGTDDVERDSLTLHDVHYETTATDEVFLQWVTPEGEIAGFLRLSLPKKDYLSNIADQIPIGIGEAMIREVHVYGKVARLNRTGGGAQHLGLGRQLIDAACNFAAEQGYRTINVISAVGTREYYRKLGFKDTGLYQQKDIS